MRVRVHAASWQIVLFFVGLAVFAFLYGVLDGGVITGTIEPLAAETGSSEAAQDGHESIVAFWALLPAFAALGLSAYLLRQTAAQSGRI